MSVLQAWLVVGVPALCIALGMFYGRSRIRSVVGYLVLFVAFAVMLPIDRASATLVGALTALLYAAGRGGEAESQGQDTSTIAVPDSVRRTARYRSE